MFRGLGTAWSRDDSLLSALPSNEEGADNWLLLRDFLLNNGYRQTSLTNFERVELADDPRRYRYEPISYESGHCQVLGFGPAGISYSADSGSQYALKTMNPESSAEYLQAVQSEGTIWNRYFQYHQHDLELLHFTRRLAALRIDKASFSDSFTASAWARHLDRFAVLAEAGLLSECKHAYSVTPRGMFFSDSIAALLAEGRLPRGRARHGSGTDNSQGHK
jgi:oxygen-independent coproporphyrinogen-3 oxidase